MTARLLAWPGHDWNQWRQVATWQKPELRTEPAGRSDLVPALGSRGNRIVSAEGWGAARQPVRLLFCRGTSLRAGDVAVRAKNDETSFEVDLKEPNGPIIHGPADAVELVEIGGVRVWP